MTDVDDSDEFLVCELKGREGLWFRWRWTATEPELRLPDGYELFRAQDGATEQFGQFSTDETGGLFWDLWVRVQKKY